ncbi:SecDF P1 head subdomain-containing protein [Actinomadura sp. 9N407]|uniref:SecDF P1 head subdomain-containing protein n=1 Tax=Actinomadura sp. 9N407 TaxID=3375154 RepID=UPI0037995378
MSDPPPYGAFPPPPPTAPPRRAPWLIPVIVVAVVLVVAVAALVTFVLLSADDDSGREGPAVLREPVRFLAVQASEPAPCAAGLLPDPSGGECLKLGAGMTVDRVDDIHAQSPDPERGRTGYSVAISFNREDAQAFTRLTETAARAQDPANRIAIIAEGKVLSAPTVSSPITGGSVEISGPSAQFTKDYTQDLVRRITGR